MVLVPPLFLMGAAARYAGVRVPRADPDGRIAFQQLSQQIKANPQRKVYRLSRISNVRNYWIDMAMQEDHWNQYNIVYYRPPGRLEEIGVNLTQQWSHVTPIAIHAVAAQGSTYRDLAR